MKRYPLGNNENPLVLRVRSMEEAERVIRFCTSQGLKADAIINPDKPLDLSDLKTIARLYRRKADKISPNHRCPCGNGKKYKKCCWSKDQDDSSPIG
jgi:hypothetical protein